MFSWSARVCSILIWTLAAANLAAQSMGPSPDYGLSFASHEVTKDQRTSLNLNATEPFRFHDDFSIAFDVSYQRLTNAFGYILRIIANDSLNIDLVSSPEHSEFYDLNLIISDMPVSIHYDFNEAGVKPLEWNTVKLAFSYSQQAITLTWNGKAKTVAFPLNKLEAYRFLFGANDFGKFNTSDVPPISLRDITLEQVNNRFVRKWQLKQHGDNAVYDTSLTHAAVVRNPVWLIDRHVSWVHRAAFVTGQYPSVAFDAVSGTLYAAEPNALHTLDSRSGKLSKVIPAHGAFIHTSANQLIYVAEAGGLLNYDVFRNALSRYDTALRRWDNTDTTYNEARYGHNNKFYNPWDSSVYMFGGYGFYVYNNAFFRFDRKQANWVKVAVQGTIPPRYLGALGLTAGRDKAFIFGGYGSKSGKQELSPQSFYDLHTFDLRSHVLQKVWDTEPSQGGHIVFSNSLVIDEPDSCFYVLSYPKDKYQGYIKLKSYGLREPRPRDLGDSIPFLFHDVHSYCDLFYSKATNELVAVTVHKEGEQYQVNVYAINNPPLASEDIYQHVNVQSLQAGQYYIVIFGVLVVLGAGCYYVYRRRRVKSTSSVGVLKPIKHDIPLAVDFHAHPVDLQPAEDRLSAIDLFGGFQVIDKNGTDITHKFTSTLKELFIFILLHSVKLEKGVSTTVLHEFLWPDKDEVSARNNRNVNLKKLRSLLECIGDVAIENTNSYVRLTMADSVSCDYRTAYRILGSESISRETIELLIKYVRRGSLLPNLQTAWLDSFKSEISNRIIDVLLAYSSQLDMYKDDKMLLDIADSIFNYDTINQEAMVLKCSVLNKKGKHSLAKNWYDHFAKEYMNLYGENYPKTFEEVVS